jgi:hypothetical protein
MTHRTTAPNWRIAVQVLAAMPLSLLEPSTENQIKTDT